MGPDLLPYLLLCPICLISNIMSQSQQSEVFASSLYDGDPRNLGYLLSDYPQNFTPVFSSQPTSNILDSDLVYPQSLPAAPEIFDRISPDRRRTFIVYNNMAHSDWVEWWLDTDFGKKSKLRWDANHQSGIWEYFHQVAQDTDGQPKVVCKRCCAILEHPSSPLRNNGGSARHGTSTMAKHIKTSACQKAATTQKSGIKAFLQAKVSILPSKRLISNILFILETRPSYDKGLLTG